MAGIECPECGTYANFLQLQKWQIPEGSHFSRIYYGTQAESSFVALQCSNEDCAFVIAGITQFDKVQDHWPKSTVSAAPIEDVPDHIARAAEEVHLDLGHQLFRSAAMLARAVVEAVAKELGHTNGNLKSKVDAMTQAGSIRPHISEGAHEVRHLGNDMAHGDFIDPVAEEDATLIVTLMDEILDEVFQSPARVDRARQNRLAKKQPSP